MINSDDNNHDKVFNAKAAITELGTRRFGPPTVEIQGKLERVRDMTHLEALLQRVFTAQSWIDLFGSLGG